jgi:hypothetical protein
MLLPLKDKLAFTQNGTVVMFGAPICVRVRSKRCRGERGKVTLLSHCCHTVVTLLLHCWYAACTLLLHCCYTAVTLLLHCLYTAVTLLLHCCNTAITPLSHCCHTAVTLLVHCCNTAVTLLLPCCSLLNIGVKKSSKNRKQLLGCPPTARTQGCGIFPFILSLFYYNSTATLIIVLI